MAKKSIIARQKKRERIVEKYAKLRKKLKKEKNYDALNALPRNASPVRLHNRCKITGRARGYMGHFGISRILEFRKLALRGQIPGIRSASW